MYITMSVPQDMGQVPLMGTPLNTIGTRGSNKHLPRIHYGKLNRKNPAGNP